jgi:hypothetical protein
MQKAIRLHMTDLGGSLGIKNLRAFCDPGVAGWSWFTNAHFQQSTYDLSKRTTYVPPTADTGPVPHGLPLADPATPNLGIAGSLTAQMGAPGFSDYLYIQLRASASVVLKFVAPFVIAYDDVG